MGRKKRKLYAWKPKPPRFRRLPECHFRIVRGSFWARLFSPEFRLAICGNGKKIPFCPLRTSKGLCLKVSSLKCRGCGCCYWCPLTGKERKSLGSSGTESSKSLKKEIE